MIRAPGTSVFDVLREEVPIERLVQVNGHRKISCISLRHADTNPSMQVYDDHVHCFGCGFHGDVVDVWSAQKGLIRPIEAALDLAREFNVRLPEMSPEARQKAEETRQQAADNLRLAQACHGALEKHPRVREWWKTRGFGPDHQKRFLLGANKDGTEAVIPFWSRGKIQGLIRRPLEGDRKYILPKAEEFPEGHRPLFIPGPLKNELYLVEGYVDAMAVVAAGRAAIAVGGTGMSVEQQTELTRLLPEDGRLYILPDDDDEGAKAARTWARTFFPKAMVCPASYDEGAKDIADAFARDGAEKTGEHLDRLLKVAEDMIDIETEALKEMEAGVREKLAYAVENIVPLLSRIKGDALRDATADIVVDQVKDLKKSWLNKAIKDERERQLVEQMTLLQEVMLEERARQDEEYRQRIEDAQQEIDALLVGDGVLGRLRGTAAEMHHVRRDEKALELALLVALGAQLEPLPNGRPLGASMLVTAQAGRGKNHIVDAAVKPLPEEFYFAFEIASGQSLYYKADEDPGFLKHTFAYPNEIEGAEQLWEFLRPMLSKGSAKKIVTAKDPDGNMTTREIIVEGPVTIAIPTIRNKTDEQLQTRLLVAELPDYPGRVKEHSAAVSAQLLPDAATADYSHQRFLWQEGLRQLTNTRRVVFPLKHEDFALDDDQISHGARLWANLLSIMATHAWLEQRNRRLVELGEGVAVEATPDDYEAAYDIFNVVCKRTVVNLSDTHRSILNGLLKLQENNPDRDGFRQREIATAGDVSLGAVSNHKTFLVTSAKLIRESEDGLSLVEGADASWWETGKMMEGLPTPAQVRSWWEERGPEPPEQREHVNTTGEARDNPHTYAESGVHDPDEHGVNTFREGVNGSATSEGVREHVQDLFTEGVNAQNGVPTGNAGERDGGVQVFTEPRGNLTIPDVIAEFDRTGSGPAKIASTYLAGETKLDYVVRAVLFAKGIDTDRWQRHLPTVEAAVKEWGKG